MSMAGSIVRSLYEDARNAAMAPVRFVDDVRYTITGLRDGSIPPRWVAWSIVSTLGAAALLVALMFPVYWIATLAFDPTVTSLYASGGVNLIPPVISAKNFVWVIGKVVTPSNLVFQIPLIGTALSLPLPEFVSGIVLVEPAGFGLSSTSRFPQYLDNSLYVSFWTVIAAMAVVIPGAYAMSRREFIARRKILFLYILLTQVGGGLGVAVLIALYAILNGVGLLNNKLALAMYYAAGAVPFNTWLLKTYMDGIPTSYEEAAIVDGAPSWRVVYEVIIPLSKAGLATVFIFVFLAGWMDYIIAATMLNTENYTLPVGLFALRDTYSVPWGQFSAFALTFATPVMLVYFFAQRYIEAGLSFGGMEG